MSVVPSYIKMNRCITMSHCVKHFVAHDSLRNSVQSQAGPNPDQLWQQKQETQETQDLIFSILKARCQNTNWSRDRTRSKKSTFLPSCFQLCTPFQRPSPVVFYDTGWGSSFFIANSHIDKLGLIYYDSSYYRLKAVNIRLSAEIYRVIYNLCQKLFTKGGEKIGRKSD